MNEIPPKADELFAWLESICLEELSPADAERLQERLRQDDSARKIYVRYLHLHALAERFEAMPTEREAAELERQFSAPLCVLPFQPLAVLRRLPQNPVIFSAAAAAAFLWAVITLLGLVNFGGGRQELPFPRPHERAIVVNSLHDVAKVSGLLHCRWAPQVRSLAMGEGIDAGDRIELQEGVLLLTTTEGCQLNVQGPALLTFTGAGQVQLDRGVLTALVPKSGRGFLVQAGRLQIVDLGTEFGVRVDEKRGIEVHVFSGQVQTRRRSSNGQEIEQRLDADQALRYDPRQERIELVAADANRFVRAPSQSPPKRHALAISPDYVAAVRRSGPLAYWRFEEIEDNLRVHDDVGKNHLEVRGLVQLRGTPENRVLSVPAGAYLASEQPFTGLQGKEYSMELWFQPAIAPQGTLLMLQAEPPGEVGNPLVQIVTWDDTRPGQTVRLLYAGVALEDASRRDTKTFHRFARQGWQHLVLVKTADRVQLYFQGVAAEGTPNQSQPSAERYRLSVGSSAAGLASPLNFQGEIDEVAIYDRALSAAEIAEHFAAVKLPF